jgi:hypothetical protein
MSSRTQRAAVARWCEGPAVAVAFFASGTPTPFRHHRHMVQRDRSFLFMSPLTAVAKGAPSATALRNRSVVENVIPNSSASRADDVRDLLLPLRFSHRGRRHHSVIIATCRSVIVPSSSCHPACPERIGEGNPSAFCADGVRPACRLPAVAGRQERAFRLCFRRGRACPARAMPRIAPPLRRLPLQTPTKS